MLSSHLATGFLMSIAWFKRANGLAWLAGLGVFLHALAIHSQSLPYTTDELQYVAWSKDLDWGYFSKPPGIAFALWLWSTMDPLAGELRFFAQLCYGFSLFISYKFFREDGQSRGRALTASLILGSIPLIGFAQWFFTTDALLLICWLMALALAWRALQASQAQSAMLWWCGLGVVVALGVLCKHSMVFFWVGMLAYWVSIRSSMRQHWAGMLLCGLVFVLLLIPHMLWLLEHPGTTIKHLIDLQQRTLQPGEESANPQSLISLARGLSQALEFTAAQWLGLGFGVVLVLRRRKPLSGLQRWLLVHSLTVLAVFVIQAGVGRANGNWALPATFTLGLAILANHLQEVPDDSAGVEASGSKSKLALWVISNLLISFFVSFGAQTLKSLRPESLLWIDRIDPFHRQRGWDEFDRALAVLNKPADIPWGVSDRDAAARIFHRYGDGQIVYRPLPGAKPNHFALRYPYQSWATAQAAQSSPSCIWFLARDNDPAQTRRNDSIALIERQRLSGRTETWVVWPEACP